MSIFKKENGTLVEYTNPIANNCIAPVEDGGTSAHAYAEGAFVMVRNILKKLTSAVAIGDTIDNTNSQDTTVATELAEIEGDIEQINTDLSGVIKWRKIWTNPNPTAEFAAQNIQTDGNDYDFVKVFFILRTGAPNEQACTECPKGSNPTLYYATGGGGGVVTYYRETNDTPDNSYVKFGNAMLAAPSTTPYTYNALLVPTEIWLGKL